MAQVLFTAAGAALGGPIGGAVGGLLGGLADRAVVSALSPARQVGPRIEQLRVQGTGEGAGLPAVFGRARVAGQMIWAARFKEKRIEGRAGGKAGAKTVEYQYSLSFAVALCEGPVQGIGRVWADGKPLDLSGVALRLHRGTEDQQPDPLIEAVEGAAPAYRGVAYVVLEDLALAPFGNRPPQLSFEVFRPLGSGLEDRLKSVCLIPGAGEFVYATTPVLRREGLTKVVAENVNNSQGRPDVMVALDQLQAQFPNLESVTLVVSWMGTDLRCGQCEIRPGVEHLERTTEPYPWRAGGVDRNGAHLISRIDDAPALGGTPADRTVLDLIAELKGRGLKVTLYPFIMMDVPADNALPDPYGGAAQAPFPWRGRITCHPAAGQAGSPDKTPAAGAQAAAFFGAAQAAHFGVGPDGLPTYAGPNDWRFRRLILHYAKLAQIAGGVDAFLIGSEMRGLTTIRSGPSAYPAVAALKALAADCRPLLGAACAVSYAADWSEYFGHQPGDGSGDAHFHLDPLWADEAIDFVGVDYYPPLADWRDDGGLDGQAGFSGPHDPAYLAANVEGGENYDWFYASEADRLAQARTPITDGAHGEAWVFRCKDLANWWSKPHHDRPGGVRSAAPTAWVPKSKPIRLTEFGCPAVDKGANSPNLFVDPKSSESHLPPFSTGARDDLMQRRALEAVLDRYGDDPMVEAMSAWCWDARPFPDFPARANLWADAPNWSLGHWLTGRAGASPLGALVQAVAARGGVMVDPGDVTGLATGYVIDRPMSLRDAVAPLAAAFAFDARENGPVIQLCAQGGATDGALAGDDLAWPADKAAPVAFDRRAEPAADVARLRFIDETADYQTGAVAVRREGASGGAALLSDLPLVTDAAFAQGAARRLLAQGGAAQEATACLSDLAALAVQPGDRVSLEGAEGVWRVTAMDHDEAPRARLTRIAPATAAGAPPDWTPAPVPTPAATPFLRLLDLPPLGEGDTRPVAAVAADPWRSFEVHAGPLAQTLTLRGRADAPAVVGVVLQALPPGPAHRWDHGARLVVRLEGGGAASAATQAVLAGANAIALSLPDGGWTVVQYQDAVQTGSDIWTLRRLLRGRGGREDQAGLTVPAGALAILLSPGLPRVDVAAGELGAPLLWRAAPAGGPAAGQDLAFTWTGQALAPLRPAHLRVRPVDDGLAVRWTRRARFGGDALDAYEVPLGEEAERYRLRMFAADGRILRTIETIAPAFVYTSAMQAADFPDGPQAGAWLEAAQLSVQVGWGAAARQVLWH